MSNRLLLEDLYNGALLATGLVVDWRGRVRRRFEIDMQASWTGDAGRMEESYRWDDGTTEQHAWQMQRLAMGQYRLTGTNIIGTGKGETLGPVLRLRYRMRVPVGKQHWHFAFDDWAARAPDGAALNRACMNKFGITWAQVLAHIKKR